MFRCKSYVFYLFFFSSLIFLFGCATVSDPKDFVIAQIDGEKVTEKDFVLSLNPKEKRIYLSFKKERTDKMLAQLLLKQESERRDTSIQKLLNKEVFSKTAVTDKEVTDYYEKNKESYKKKKKEEWRAEIVKLLRDYKSRVFTQKLLGKLAKKSDVKYYLPTVPSQPPQQKAHEHADGTTHSHK